MTIKRASAAKRLIGYARRSGGVSQFSKGLFEEAIVRAWSSAAVRQCARPFVPSADHQKWVFVVGCFNSGTTILKNMIAAHPDVASMPREGVRFTSHLSNLEVNGHHMMWDDEYESLAAPAGGIDETSQSLRKDWGLFLRNSKPMALEKSVANSARIEWLSKAFPGARFVAIHRNGFCVAEGLRRRAQPPEWLKQESNSYPLEMAARQWVRANTCILDAAATVDPVSLVPFERLTQDPVGTIGAIFDFIGLDPSPLKQTAGGVEIAGTAFEVRDPNPASLARLSEGDMNTLKPVLLHTMSKLGYAVP